MAKTLDSICRLCLENCKDEWFNLLEDNVQRKIMLCLNTEVSFSEGIYEKAVKYFLVVPWLFLTLFLNLGVFLKVY